MTWLPKWEILAAMSVIAKSSLKEFWERPGCADARGPLHSWYEEALKAKWRRPQDIKDQYASAIICGKNRVVFNVGGNKYRLVVEVQYKAGIVCIKFVGTHAQHDRIDVESVNDY
jgi:mRNA interferase HigB